MNPLHGIPGAAPANKPVVNKKHGNFRYLLGGGLIIVLLRTAVRQFDTPRRSRAAPSQPDLDLEQAGVRSKAKTMDPAKAVAASRDSEQQDAGDADTLQARLENIDQGVMMVDASHRVTAYNQRVLELLDLPNDLLERRPYLSDVPAYQWENRGQNREFPTAGPKGGGLLQDAGLDGQPNVYEHKRLDGRVIEVRSLSLHGGGIVRTYSDITDRKAANARIRFIARHDSLTLLANRSVLQDRLDQAVGTSTATQNGLALLHIDLDRFKSINDTYGHAVGDHLLIEVVQRMRGIVREDDLLARMGGDKFAILQAADGQPIAAASLAERLIKCMSDPFLFKNGMRLAVTLSIGIGIYPVSGASAVDLRRNADIALCRAKESGRNTYRLFDAAMDQRQQARFQMEQDLRDAVGLQAFHLMYQPIVDVETDAVVGFEALLRWTHPTRGAVAPEEFVTLAELNGLIVPLGRWVMETACAEAAGWPAGMRVAVNLSPLQFRQGNLTGEIVDVLRRTGLAPNRLELEVTEGVLLEDSAAVLQTIYALRALGVSITLDDFGTGHASLSYLRQFPFDKLKIDQSFIRNLQEDRQSGAIVEAVLLLGRRLGLDVVAEGVETPAQLDMLRKLRCPLVQGFLKGRPMLAEAARGLGHPMPTEASV